MAQHIKRSGVYKITNKENGKFYIGSSKDITNRFSQHRSALRKGIHSNQHLQNAWVLYGEAAFVFEIIEECILDKSMIIGREQHYIDNMKPEYNILRIAGSRLGSKMSEQTKAKIKANHSTPEYREKARKKRLEQPPLSNETKQKISQKLSGRSMSEDTKLKLSEATRGKKKMWPETY